MNSCMLYGCSCCSFVSFEFVHVQRSNCPVPIPFFVRNRGPERASNFIEDSAQKMAAISTMDHN